MIDYDNDGRNDLFTYGIAGLKVYRNVGNATDGLQWELVSELLQTVVPNGNQHLYVSSSDIPAIVDVDFDGDIDDVRIYDRALTPEEINTLYQQPWH